MIEGCGELVGRVQGMSKEVTIGGVEGASEGSAVTSPPPMLEGGGTGLGCVSTAGVSKTSVGSRARSGCSLNGVLRGGRSTITVEQWAAWPRPCDEDLMGTGNG